jgi:hypothetical protein
MKFADQLIKREMENNPEVSLILEIAARAKAVESSEPPKEIRVSTEVTVIPAVSQLSA